MAKHRARRTTSKRWLAATTVAHALDMDLRTLRARFARSSANVVRRAGEELVDFDQLEGALSHVELTRFRRRYATLRMQTRTSRYWVAGYPDVVAQWHPSKNEDLFPDEVSYGSGRRIWWKCDRGPDHEWATTPAHRIGGRRGCPFCAGHRASITNCLATIAPKLAAQWHPTKNATRTPVNVVAGSTKKSWWRCTKGPDHEWPTSPHSRISGVERGCPFCAGKRASVTNSLATQYPDVAKEWHPTRNRGLTPDRVVMGSHRDVWWQCAIARDHVWRAGIKTRTRLASGCPFCANLRASVTNSIAKVAPRLARQWHPTKNGSLTPADVSAYSTTYAWWKCPEGADHVWRAKISNRMRLNTGCPCCVGRQVTKTNSLRARYATIADQWDRERNAPLRAEEVSAFSNRAVWWRCDRGPDHRWSAPISSRTSAGGACPFCLGRRPSITNCLRVTHPRIAAEWHPTRNAPTTPEEVTAGSDREIWWRCSRNPRHVWQKAVGRRTRDNNNCPQCRDARISRRAGS